VTPDLKTLTDADLWSQWQVATDAMNAVYRELTMLSKVRADYNVANYLKLHRSEEGKQRYRAAHLDFDATEAEARQRFHAAAAVCRTYRIEAERRGLVQP
jgi:hypothetical protein